MHSLLDSCTYYYWVAEEAILKDGILRILLRESVVVDKAENIEITPSHSISAHRIEQMTDGRQVLIEFYDVVCLHVFDENARVENYNGEVREKEIIALHNNSTLLAWLKLSTILNIVTPGELFHYSVLTANEYYHVITRNAPSVREIGDA